MGAGKKRSLEPSIPKQRQRIHLEEIEYEKSARRGRSKDNRVGSHTCGTGGAVRSWGWGCRHEGQNPFVNLEQIGRLLVTLRCNVLRLLLFDMLRFFTGC
ncbi:hypothetical protein Acr_18g0011920 [Actinidia rufa]|uniref:Uncharacterized protein n=1 Tax=Actinidia rufa TaxID=165716 RepID=A0A7J0G8G6_9ERIC|nr:hypothetical protein Acr_18g0011920 [Actinidia rufa]